MDVKDLVLPQVEEVSLEEMDNSPIAKLNPRHQRFTHLYLSGQYTVTQIAQLLNVTNQTIHSWLNNPDVKNAIETYQSEEDEIVKQGLKALRLKAMYKMNQLMDSPIDGISYQAARDVLDRTGHKAPTKQEVTVEVKTFEQQLREMMVEKDIEDDFIDSEAIIVSEFVEDEN